MRKNVFQSDWKGKVLRLQICKLHREISETGRSSTLNLPCKIDDLISEILKTDTTLWESSWIPVRRKFQASISKICSCLNEILGKMDKLEVRRCRLHCKILPGWITFKLMQRELNGCKTCVYNERVVIDQLNENRIEEKEEHLQETVSPCFESTRLDEVENSISEIDDNTVTNFRDLNDSNELPESNLKVAGKKNSVELFEPSNEFSTLEIQDQKCYCKNSLEDLTLENLDCQMGETNERTEEITGNEFLPATMENLIKDQDEEQECFCNNSYQDIQENHGVENREQISCVESLDPNVTNKFETNESTSDDSLPEFRDNIVEDDLECLCNLSVDDPVESFDYRTENFEETKVGESNISPILSGTLEIENNTDRKNSYLILDNDLPKATGQEDSNKGAPSDCMCINDRININENSLIDSFVAINSSSPMEDFPKEIPKEIQRANYTESRSPISDCPKEIQRENYANSSSLVEDSPTEIQKENYAEARSQIANFRKEIQRENYANSSSPIEDFPKEISKEIQRANYAKSRSPISDCPKEIQRENYANSSLLVEDTPKEIQKENYAETRSRISNFRKEIQRENYANSSSPIEDFPKEIPKEIQRANYAKSRLLNSDCPKEIQRQNYANSSSLVEDSPKEIQKENYAESRSRISNFREEIQRENYANSSSPIEDFPKEISKEIQRANYAKSSSPISDRPKVFQRENYANSSSLVEDNPKEIQKENYAKARSQISNFRKEIQRENYANSSSPISDFSKKLQRENYANLSSPISDFSKKISKEIQREDYAKMKSRLSLAPKVTRIINPSNEQAIKIRTINNFSKKSSQDNIRIFSPKAQRINISIELCHESKCSLENPTKIYENFKNPSKALKNWSNSRCSDFRCQVSKCSLENPVEIIHENLKNPSKTLKNLPNSFYSELCCQESKCSLENVTKMYENIKNSSKTLKNLPNSLGSEFCCQESKCFLENHTKIYENFKNQPKTFKNLVDSRFSNLCQESKCSLENRLKPYENLKSSPKAIKNLPDLRCSDSCQDSKCSLENPLKVYENFENSSKARKNFVGSRCSDKELVSLFVRNTKHECPENLQGKCTNASIHCPPRGQESGRNYPTPIGSFTTMRNSRSTSKFVEQSNPRIKRQRDHKYQNNSSKIEFSKVKKEKFEKNHKTPINHRNFSTHNNLFRAFSASSVDRIMHLIKTKLRRIFMESNKATNTSKTILTNEKYRVSIKNGKTIRSARQSRLPFTKKCCRTIRESRSSVSDSDFREYSSRNDEDFVRGNNCGDLFINSSRTSNKRLAGGSDNPYQAKIDNEISQLTISRQHRRIKNRFGSIDKSMDKNQSWTKDLRNCRNHIASLESFGKFEKFDSSDKSKFGFINSEKSKDQDLFFLSNLDQDLRRKLSQYLSLCKNVKYRLLKKFNGADDVYEGSGRSIECCDR